LFDFLFFIVLILLATIQARLNKYVVEHLEQTLIDFDLITMAHLDNYQVDYDVTLDKLQSAYGLSDQKIIRVWLSFLMMLP
jgi:hypothetical protein